MSVRKRWHKLHWTKQVGIIVAGAVVVGALAGGAYAQFGPSLTQSSTTGVNLQKGLIGWWKLDGNANDSSPYRRKGTIVGAVPTADRKGASAKAYSFNGSGNYIDAGRNPITGSSPFTLSAWIKNTSLSQYGGAIAIGASGVGQAAYIGTVSTAQTGANNSIGGGFYNTNIGTSTATTGQWVHVALTFSGGSNGTATIYINGVSAGSRTFTPNLASTYLRIGRVGSDTIYDFQGSIDDARIYSRALNANEIKSLYQQYDPGIKLAAGENQLVGWWKLNGNANDSTPYRENGTITTNVTVASDRKNMANSAYAFDGVNTTNTHKITFGSTPTLNSKLMTISAWVYATASTSFNTAVSRYDTNAAVGDWILGLNTAGACRFYIVGSSGNADNNAGAHTCDPGAWHLLTGTYDGTNSMLYVDGVLVSTIPVSLPNTISGVANLTIGGRAYSSSTWAGSVDDVRFYSRALSASDIKKLYQSYSSQININSSGSTVALSSGLLAYWNMNGNANDSTPYRNNGVLNGTTTLTTDRMNRANSAYSFNGTNSGIGVTPWQKLTGSSPRTVVAWFQTTTSSAPSSTKMIVNWGNGSTNTGTYLRQFNGNIGVDTTGCNKQISETPYVDGNWHLIVGTISGTSNTLYLDAVNKGSVSCAANTGATDLAIGRADNAVGSGSRFTGSIDDVRIYNRVLSQAEITALYNDYR